jgi:ribosomal-protein-alanine N-acetyltransferase
VKFLTIKLLTEELLPEALNLDRVCLGGLWSLDGYRRELASPNSDLLVLLKEDPSSPQATPQILGLGCLWAIVEEAHITLLAVHPDYHRQGFGQALLWALLQGAQQRGLERATLEVKVSNHSAISLYTKFGFQKVGLRRGYYPDTGDDALVLWRNGLHYPEFLPILTDWHRHISDRLEQHGWHLKPEA